MKKTLLSTLLLILVSVVSSAAVVKDSIYVQKVDFESGVLPEGWTQEFVSSDLYGEHPWVIEKVAESDYPKPNQKDNGEYILALRNSTNATIGYTTRLISPVMDLTQNKVFQPILVFSHAQQQRTGDFDQLKVYYRSNANDNWVRLDGRNGNPEFNQKITKWQRDTIQLTSQSDTYQVMFEVTDRFGRGVVLDNIEVRPMPTCEDPYGFAVSSLTSTAATVSWNASFDTDSFEVVLSKVAIDTLEQVNPADIVYYGFLTDDEFSFSTAKLGLTLTRNQRYYLYVRSFCQGATSEWAGTSFRTQNLINLPLNVSFTNGDGWSYKTTSISHIQYWSHGTSIKHDDGVTMEFMPYVNTNTEPGTATAGYYAYDQNFCLVFTGARNLSTDIPAGEYVYCATPEINLQSLESVQVSFWGTAYQSVGDKYASGIIVGVMTDPEDFFTFVPVDTCYITENKTFNKFGVSLAGYKGEGKYIAFASDFKDKANRFYIDEISIKQTSAPIWPSNIEVSKVNADGFDLSLNSRGAAYNLVVTERVTNIQTGQILLDPSTIDEAKKVTVLSNQTEQNIHVSIPTTAGGKFLEIYAQGIGANGEAGDWSLPVTVRTPLYLANSAMPFKITWEETDTWTERELYPYGSAGHSQKLPQSVIAITQYAPNYYGQNASSPSVSQVSSSTSNYKLMTMEGTASAHYLLLKKEFNEVTKGDLELYSYNHKYGNYVVLPQVEDLSKVLLKFYMQRYSTSAENSSKVAVGIMSDPYDITTFDTIAMFECNAPLEYQPYSCTFENYKGQGKLIAILAVDAENPFESGSLSSSAGYGWKNWYASEQRIDWINLFALGECNPIANPTVEADHESVKITWGANGMSEWIVQLLDSKGDRLDSVKVSTPVYEKDGLSPHTSYTYMISPLCDESFEMSDWLSFTTECVPQTPLPYVENFEVYTENISNSNNRDRQMPYCWGYPTYSYTPSSGGSSDVKPSYYPYITGTSSSAHKGTKAFYLASSSATNNNGDTWVSLPILADSLNELQIDLWTKGNGLAYDDQLYIGTMSDPNDIATFVLFDSIRLTGNQWQEHIKPMSACKAENSTNHLALKLPKGSHYYYIDDIVIDYIVDCEKVFKLTTSAPKTNGATFSWDKTNADKYEVLVTKKSVDDPDTSIPAADIVEQFETTLNEVVYTNDDLTLNTTYYVRVRSICGERKMAWSEQAVFKTTCEAQTPAEMGTLTFSPPNSIGCWSVGVMNGTTSAPSASGSTTGKYGYYLYLFNTAASDGAYAIMPPLDIDDISKYEITFDVLSGSTIATNVKRITVGIISNPADLSTYAPLTVVNAPYSADSTGAITVTIPFDSYEGDFVTGAKGTQVMFLSESGDSTNYIQIDNVHIDLIPSCPAPSEIVADSVGTYGAKICWNPTGAAYELAITETKLAPNDAKAKVVQLIQNLTDTVAVVNDLKMLTQYFMFVRTICGVGDTSTWSNARSFTTICPESYPLPFQEGFESYTTTTGNRKPDCWTCYYLNGTTVTEGTGASYPSFGTTAANAHAGTRSIYMYSDNAATKKYSFAAMPYIDADLSKAMISFWYKANAYAAATPTRKVVVGIAEEVSTLDTLMATLTVLDTVVQTNTSSTISYEKYTRIIGEKYSGNGKYIVLIGIEGNGTTSSGGMYVDDIEISLVPTCFVPDDMSAKMYDTFAELSWTQMQGDNKAWDVAYGLKGTAEADLTIVPADTNVFVINGLQPSTEYDFYVRANCGEGDLSDWRGPVTATTLYQVKLADAQWTFDSEPTKPYIVGQTNKAPLSWYVNNFVTGIATVANVPYIQANSYVANTDVLNTKYAYSGDSTMRLYGPGAYVVLPVIENENYDNLQVRFMASDIYIYPYKAAGDNRGKDSLYYTTYSYKSATQATSSYNRTIRVGVATDPYDMSTFEELTPYILPIVGTSTSTKASDAVDPEDNSWWREVVVPLYGAKGKFIVFAAPEVGNNVVYFDNVVVEAVDPSACVNVTKLAMNEDALKYNYAEFNWLSPKNKFKVTVTEKDSTKAYATAIVDSVYFSIDTLQEQTTYVFSVQTICGEDLSKAVTLEFTTPCKPTDVENAYWGFTDNLYQYGSSATYVLPECWDEGLAYGSSASYHPYAIMNPNPAGTSQCYSRGDTVNGYALQFYTTNSYYNAYVALPELSFPLDSMTLHFWGRAARFYSSRATTANNKSKLSAANNNYSRVLIIGVIKDAADFTTFVPIDTIRYDKVWTTTTVYAYNDESENNYWQEYALPLAKYAGKGRLAIVAPRPGDFSTASSPTSYFYIDDLEIVKGDFCTPITGQTAANITSTSATIRWSPLVTNNTVQAVVATKESFEESSIIYNQKLVDVSSFDISGLKPSTTYYYVLKHICNEEAGDESDWSSITSFTTDYVLRFNQNFNDVKTTIPAGWNRSISVAAADLFNGTKELTEASATASYAWRTSATGDMYIYANTTYNNASSTSSTSNSQYNWLITPPIDLTANEGDSLLLSFDVALRSQSDGQPNPNSEVTEQFMVVVSEDEGATWKAENATIWSNDGEGDFDFAELYNGGQFASKYLEISKYAGKQIKVAFYIGSYAPAKIGGTKNILLLDNIQLNKYDLIENSDKICRWEDYYGYNFDIDANQLPAGTNQFERFTPAKSNSKDLIERLTIEVEDESVTQLDGVILCEGDTYNDNNFSFIATKSATYKQKLQSGIGCDSTVVLPVTVNMKKYEDVTETICQGSYYEFKGEKYYTSINKTETFVSAEGCDSIVTLHLTVKDILRGETEEVFLCPGMTYAFTEKYPALSADGEYSDTVVNARGCDSIAAIKITNVPEAETLIRGAICQGEVYDEGLFGGLRNPGDYSTPHGDQGLKTIYGCDSIVTLHLMVAQPTEAQTFEIYDTISSGELPYVLNGVELLPKGTERGVYPRTITLGCGEAMVVINVDNADGVDDIYANTLAVTPNPVAVGENVRVLGQFNNAEVEVITATGAVAYRQQFTTGQITLPGISAAGIYLVRLTDSKGEYHAKLVVK